MRLTRTRDPRRGTVRITAEGAADYPPGHLAQVLAVAVQRAVHQLDDDPQSAEQLPAPRAATDDTPALVTPDPGEPYPGAREEAVTRRRVLRMLDRGATEGQAADRFGVDAAQVARWDDDAARDAHTDLLADSHGWHHAWVAS